MSDVGPLNLELFYRYNYQYLPPLAMSNGLQICNIPRLKWFAMVAGKVLELVINDLAAKFEDKADDSEFAKAKAEAEAIARRFNNPLQLFRWRKHFQDLQDLMHFNHDPGDAIEPYNELFATLPLPAAAQTFMQPAYFAELRVAGFNPLVLKLARVLPTKVPLTQAIFQKAPGFEQDFLSAALAEDRLFMVDYDVLTLAAGQNPAPKQVYQPIGIFAIPAAGGPLRAVAVQGGQDPATFPLFTPIDGEDWNKVRSAFDTADTNYHELISHLGRTHLLIEPFIVATHKQLGRRHPVRRLILPSLEGTDFINGAAVEFLVAPGGAVDKLLMGTIESDLSVTAQAVQEPGFDELMLHRFLASRGLMDKRLIYPYRDDALLIWGVVRQWVTDYLDLYYTDDAAVQADKKLQRWAADLVSQTGGRVKGFAQNGRIQTKAYLIDALTMILFTAGPQHAAVNFPQNKLMSYTPGSPLAGYEPVPNQSGSAGPWIDQVPPLKMAQLQLEVLYLLGTVYYTRLGDYKPKAFEDKVKPALATYQKNLVDAEAEIVNRNKTRPIPYDYLLPSKIPMSINI